MTRHFSAFLGDVGTLAGTTPTPPFSMQMLPNRGLLISQIDREGGVALAIRINGLEVRRWSASDHRASHSYVLAIEPPIFVPPSATLEIGFVGHVVFEVSISGYCLEPQDLGL